MSRISKESDFYGSHKSLTHREFSWNSRRNGRGFQDADAANGRRVHLRVSNIAPSSLRGLLKLGDQQTDERTRLFVKSWTAGLPAWLLIIHDPGSPSKVQVGALFAADSSGEGLEGSAMAK